MSDSTDTNILKRIEAAGRKVLPMHEFLVKNDPKTFDAFDRFLMNSIYRSDGMSAGHKEMLLACVCVAAGSAAPVIENHCRRALAAGLPKDHLLQAMEITAVVLATRTLASGVNAVMAAEAK